MDLSQVYALEVAFLFASVLLHRRGDYAKWVRYLPCFAAKSPLVDVFPGLIPTNSILASVLPLAILDFINEFPATPHAILKGFDG